MSNHDPLRLWLQTPRSPICECEHCFRWSMSEEGFSPIETMMANAMNMLRGSGCFWELTWAVHHQWPLLSYTADFALVAPKFTIVIECDGHDYHERTKEQAAHDRKRDRSMVEAGLLVLRFTGSEIWRNPFACAEQVLNLALSLQVRMDMEEGKK